MLKQYKLRKVNKISLKNDYPCPCRRKGNLKPIILTEALGCDRCQQIFVVQENQQTIEQLATIYQKRSWRWNGHRWIDICPGLNPNFLSLVFVAVVLSPVIFAIAIPLVLQSLSTASVILWVVLCLLLIILLGLVLWLTYRH